jgi:hypothetical protein
VSPLVLWLETSSGFVDTCKHFGRISSGLHSLLTISHSFKMGTFQLLIHTIVNYPSRITGTSKVINTVINIIPFGPKSLQDITMVTVTTTNTFINIIP